MTSDQRGKRIRLNGDVNNDGLEKKKSITIADLPSSLLELIMYYLVLKDNIRASAVCKAWREAAESVRVVGKHPWVISLLKDGDLINVFDPLHQKMYTLNFPELTKTSLCYSKDGWLLMRRSSSADIVDLFFFNPFTRELISLPKCTLFFHAIAFSSAPTSGTCTVIAWEHFTRHISVCYPGATEWTEQDISCPYQFGPYLHSNIVYANGHFYWFDSENVLFDFDIASRTVIYQRWDEQMCPYIHNKERDLRPQRIYLMEQKGVLFVMYTCGTMEPMVYKLVSSKWVEMIGKALDGLAIFVSSYSSETRLDVLRMRNSVYFPRYDSFSNRCVSYSFDEARFYPDKQFLTPKRAWQWLLCLINTIWIDPPSKNVFDFM